MIWEPFESAQLFEPQNGLLEAHSIVWPRPYGLEGKARERAWSRPQCIEAERALTGAGAT